MKTMSARMILVVAVAIVVLVAFAAPAMAARRGIVAHAEGDACAPVTTSDNPGALAIWSPGGLTVTLAPVDFESSVAATYYRVDGGEWTEGTVLPPFRTWKRAGGSGTHTIEFYSVDVNANVEAVQTENVLIDSVKPVTRDNAPATLQSSDVLVTLTATDSLSGVAAVYYSVDDGSLTAGSAVSIAAPADHSNDGIHYIRYFSEDSAGNVETREHVAQVTIDTVTGP